KGYPDGTFRPNQSITRAEFAAIAASFASEAVPSGGMFKDIEGHWAQESIERAAAAGWIKGSNGMFRPNDKITRAEVITTVNRMLDRVPDADHLLADMKTFSDNTPDKWYYADVQEATNSHDYERAEDGVTGIWTELLPEQDWTALEKAWSTAADANVVDVASNLMGEDSDEDSTGDGDGEDITVDGDGDGDDK
ncbi:MAG: S-layer homology domain-containing protein, partial [Oscillibacter sp.]|nr:S-layer homology domain-containing protein [Oscillibacter sp.]